MVSGERLCTPAATPMTNSDLRRLAFAINASSSLSKTTCVIPPRSRISMNRRPPRSRTRCTQPSNTTSAPTSSTRSVPQVWVRVRSPSGSATSSQRLRDGRARGRHFVSLLCLRCQVLYRHRTCLDLVVADDGDVRNTLCVSVLDLLPDFVRIGVDEHAQSGCPQLVGHSD